MQIFLRNLFLSASICALNIMNKTDFASYADDNIPYVVGSNIEDVIIKLQKWIAYTFQWFYDNQMKANPDQCHLICSTEDKLNVIADNQKHM